MRSGRPIAVLMLNDEERATLERWARRPKTAQALAQRARIVLACATGKPNMVVAEKMYLTKQCVGKWRSRFVIEDRANGTECSNRSKRSIPRIESGVRSKRL
jgi:hypothetical protein